MKNIIEFAPAADMAAAHLDWIARDGLRHVSEPMIVRQYQPHDQDGALRELRIFWGYDTYKNICAKRADYSATAFIKMCAEAGVTGWAIFLLTGQLYGMDDDTEDFYADIISENQDVRPLFYSTRFNYGKELHALINE